MRTAVMGPASFRARLILAVFSVLAAVATDALLLAEWKFAATCQRLSYTMLGHRVNLASRLCRVAGPGEIMTDAETARLAGACAGDDGCFDAFEGPVRAC